MSDIDATSIDATSDLRERLSDLQADLARVRDGRKPSPRVDLMTWRARQPANDTGPVRLFGVFRQSLRDDWKGVNEALHRWMARIDERFARR